ncbi:hypothetical protein KKF81_02165 [Candidatus Micrarchaeota archaeon]|nr:hypothetical protein [Candidatus Micrarchaeota archaeon]MBU1165724.1 hypothetical protein [Candidatus Micrarchaeota archaeon]MBU1887091.1 hypothetical protein [Candidatus Micrarchaeota archaeon]
MSEENASDESQKMGEAKKLHEQLRTSLRIALEESAYERMTNVALANRELYVAAAKYILMAFKQARRKITDDELIKVLKGIKEQNEKRTSITFVKK